MIKILKITGIIFTVLVVLVGIIYFFFPQKLVDFTNYQNASSANLKLKTISINGYQTHYYTNANNTAKDTLVLLHGLGDEKNSFVQTAKLLSEDYYLILPDLLASGENSKKENLDLSINGQVQFLYKFLNKLGVKSFNLGGNSMGGHISAAFTIAYPKNVKSLTLINAPGLKLDSHVVYTGFGKALQNDEDLNNVFSRVFYKIPEMPSPIKKMFIKQINESRDYLNNTIITQIKKGKYFDLKDQINQINVPTLILWGKHDKVVKFNVAERYKRDIPLAKLKILENASHSPQLEIPNEVALNINQFIKELK